MLQYRDMPVVTTQNANVKGSSKGIKSMIAEGGFCLSLGDVDHGWAEKSGYHGVHWIFLRID